MADFTLSRGTDENPLVLAASAAAGEVWQLADGRAAYMAGLAAGVSGDTRTFTTTGTGVLTKTAGFVAIKGRRAFWDHSANAITYKKVNDRDFYVGRFAADAASADTTCAVTLNINPPADIDLLRDGVISVPTGTKAAGAFGFPKQIGGAAQLELTGTNEPQCIDMLSRDRFALGSNWIADFVIVPEANGSTSDVDFNIGVANGTSTTDADAITESVFVHIDGGSTNICAESDDGTTEVAATDTTADISAGTDVANRTEIWIDGRDVTSVKIYVDGSRVLSGTTFVLTAATGPLGILAHLEKVSGTATGKFTIERAEVNLREQD